jgi:hypothetical protein
MTDLHGTVTHATLLAAGARSATANGSAVEVRDYHGRAFATLDSGAGSGTTPTLNVKLQGSADNSTWSDISGASFSEVTTSASFQKIGVVLHEAPRYVRARAVIGGDTPNFTFSVHLYGTKDNLVGN